MQRPETGPTLDRVPWKIRDVAIATAVPFGIVAIALAASQFYDVGARNQAGEAIPPWSIFIFQGILIGLVWVFGIRKYKVPWRTLGLRPAIGRGVMWLPFAALAVSLAVTAAYAYIVTLLGVDILAPDQEIRGDLLGTGLTRLLNTLVIGIWGPFTEEIFFRGFVLAAMLPVMGPLRATLLSAAVFALAHLDLGTLFPIFVTGVILAWLYIKTRSLWPPITAHAAQNLLALVVTSQA